MYRFGQKEKTVILELPLVGTKLGSLSKLTFEGRKLKLMVVIRYLIPEALAQGCDTLISIGGVQSNHTRQVAGVAAKLGLKVCVNYLFIRISFWKSTILTL